MAYVRGSGRDYRLAGRAHRLSPGSQTRTPSTADLRRASHRESASHEVAFGEALRRLDTYAGLTPKSPASAAREVLSLPSESCVPWPEVGSGGIMFVAGAGRR